MGSQWTQLLILLLAIGAPAISWIFGKLREQAELKKARDAARRSDEESLRVTQLTDRTAPELSPAAQRERERRELAARRQAQLRELRQRQYERATKTGPVLTRGPGTAGGPVQTPRRPTGPLRPGVPSAPPGRPPTPVAVPPRPGPRRPAPPTARPIPSLPVRRPTVMPAPVVRSREEEPPPAVARGAIAATEIGQGRAREALRGSRGVGADVRGMLMQPDGSPRAREELARAIALVEVLAPAVALRPEEQHPWNRV